MPDSLQNYDTSQATEEKTKEVANRQKEYIRDVQLIVSLCLDLMPQACPEFIDRLESPQPVSSII